MLGVGRLNATDRHGWLSRLRDNRRLRQPTQEMRRYQRRLSRVEVLVVLFGKIVSFALKQANDPRGGMGYCSLPDRRAVVIHGFARRFRLLFTLYHRQLDPLSVLESNFGERFENPILEESFDGFCHG